MKAYKGPPWRCPQGYQHDFGTICGHGVSSGSSMPLAAPATYDPGWYCIYGVRHSNGVACGCAIPSPMGALTAPTFKLRPGDRVVITGGYRATILKHFEDDVYWCRYDEARYNALDVPGEPEKGSLIAVQYCELLEPSVSDSDLEALVADVLLDGAMDD